MPGDDGRKGLNQNQYQQLLGFLLYLTNTRRPEIAYYVSYLPTFMTNPTIILWNAAKHILRFIKNTINYGLWYSKGNNEEKNFTKYSDYDWAQEKASMKSISGYIFTFVGWIIWYRSKQQSSVAQKQVLTLQCWIWNSWFVYGNHLNPLAQGFWAFTNAVWRFNQNRVERRQSRMRRRITVWYS